jgi:uncharacterized membrane protein
MNTPRFRHVSSRFRVNLCGVFGVAVGVAVAAGSPWQMAVLAGWCAMAAALLVWIWLDVLPCDATHTRMRATIEDNSRGAALVVVSTASVLSLTGMAFGLVKANHSPQAWKVALTIAAVASVVLSWAVVHTMFALRYAHLYYTDPEGGIDFHDGHLPDYGDFAYVAFTVGMAFAVSDTDVIGRVMRRAVLRHSLLSYLFGAVVVGMTINIMAGFVH